MRHFAGLCVLASLLLPAKQAASAPPKGATVVPGNTLSFELTSREVDEETGDEKESTVRLTCKVKAVPVKGGEPLAQIDCGEDYGELAGNPSVFYSSESCYGYTAKGFSMWLSCPANAAEAKQEAEVLVGARQRLGKVRIGSRQIPAQCTKGDMAEDPSYCISPLHGFISASHDNPSYGFDVEMLPPRANEKKPRVRVGQLSVTMLMGKRGKKVTPDELSDPMSSPLCKGQGDTAFKGVEVSLPVSGHSAGAMLAVTVSGGVTVEDEEGYMECDVKNLKRILSARPKLSPGKSVHQVKLTNKRPGRWPCHFRIEAKVHSAGAVVEALPFEFGWGCIE
jgi:hypothetical protein